MKELRSPAVIVASMEAWARNSQYKDLYKSMGKKPLALIRYGLSEIVALTPMNWATWWAQEHNRFIRGGVSQRELLTVHECMHQFLSAYSSGKIKRDYREKTTKKEVQADSNNSL